MATSILIIEDNHENLNLMTYLLTMHGYQVVQAADGDHGLMLSKTSKCDLIICDIQLPKIDGLEIIRRLKTRSNPLRTIPIIAITAYAMIGDREKILLAGADGYISKPVEPENFVNEIESFLTDNKRVTRIDLAHPAQQEHPELVNNHKRGTILIVDDNPADRYLSEMLLNSIGFQTLLASSVEEAEQILQDIVPELILSDFHLHERDGLELFSLIRANEELKDIPFVMISSSILPEQRSSIILKTGEIEAIIIRPVEPEIFIDIIEKVWAATRIAPNSSVEPHHNIANPQFKA
ncbi:MAG: response regulator [Candidatus Berkiella sp.]